MIKYIFIFTFVASCLFQMIFLKTFSYTDSTMWSDQAFYVETADPRQFDATLAYGHPGGPVVLGTVITHKILNLPYRDALIVFLTIFNSLVIASISLLCYLLNKESLWWLIVFGILSFNRLYVYATPPSATVTLLLTLLCFFTLYIYYQDKEKIRLPSIICWSVISGLAISSRVDIGSVMSFSFFILLWQKINWKQMAAVLFVAFTTFFMTNPFMWFMPVQHVLDIFNKIFYHYADFAVMQLSFLGVLNISYMTFVSMVFAIVFLFRPERFYVLVPKSFLWVILLTTTLLYSVFLTSHYQAERYFLPMIFIWEAFLPLFIFSAFPKTTLVMPKTIKDVELKVVVTVASIFILIMFI